MSGNWTFYWDQGATIDQTLTWSNSEGTPYNLTGWTAKMQIRERAGGTLYQTLTTSDATIVLGGAAGTIRLTLSATVTAAWTFLTGVYDLELTNGSNQVTRLLRGSVVVSPEVTV